MLLTPYLVTEGHYIDHGILKNVGNVTNNKTFTNTYLSDELLVGRGKGTIETTDRQSIDWISSDLGKSSDNQWVFQGVMLFSRFLYVYTTAKGIFRKYYINDVNTSEFYYYFQCHSVLI